jgi:hypothetical protein
LWLPFGMFILGTSYLFLRTEAIAGTPPVQRMEDQWFNTIDRCISFLRGNRS